MKATIQLYVHQRLGEEPRVLTSDMSEYPDVFGALLGMREVEVEIEPFDTDPVAAMIDSLQAKIERERGESQARIRFLSEQISKLQCIEYKPEDAA